MESGIRNGFKSYPESADTWRDATLILLLGVYSGLSSHREEAIFVTLLTILQELVAGQFIFNDPDVLRQSAQLLHFILDILF